jgi:hypothetical protein
MNTSIGSIQLIIPESSQINDLSSDILYPQNDSTLSGIEPIVILASSSNSIQNYSFYLNNTLLNEFTHNGSDIFGINEISKQIDSVVNNTGILNASDYTILNETNNNALKIISNNGSIDDLYHYKGVFTFKNQTIDATPLNWTYGNANLIETKEDKEEHDNVLRLEYDGSDGWAKKQIASEDIGIIEWWAFIKNTQKASYFYLRDGTDEAVRIRIDNDLLYVRDAGVYIDEGGIIDQETWYHFKVDFNCDSDTFDFYIDNVLISNDYDFINNVAKIDYFEFFSAESGGEIYLDSLSPVWMNHENYTYNENDLLDFEQIIFNGMINTTFTYNFSEISNQLNQIDKINVSYSIKSNDTHYLEMYIQDFGHDSLDLLENISLTTTYNESNVISDSQSRIHISENGIVNISLYCECECEIIIDKLNVTISFYQLDEFNLFTSYLFNTTEFDDGFYNITFYIQDNESNIVNSYIDLEIDNVATVTPPIQQLPANFDDLETLIFLGTIIALGLLALLASNVATRKGSDIILSNLDPKRQERVIAKSGKNYVKKNELKVRKLQVEHKKKWFKEFLNTNDGKAFKNDIKMGACKTKIQTEPCSKSGLKQNKKLLRKLKKSMEEP